MRVPGADLDLLLRQYAEWLSYAHELETAGRFQHAPAASGPDHD